MSTIDFQTSLDFIAARIDAINPVSYGRTRNFIDGEVTYLSPYISRGVISTRQVLENVLDKGYSPKRIEKFIQELAWRDYWQQIWKAKGNGIDEDLKHPQPEVRHHGLPEPIDLGETGIDAIDMAIKEFYETGYMHNHVRMYVASLCTNIAKCHWSEPAKWLYHHLLDGDWASNALSWQWVAGSNSNKKYYANQGNINKFCYSKQWGTFIDVSYEELTEMKFPQELEPIISCDLKTNLPKSNGVLIDPSLPSLIYNFYNLDPHWKSGMNANRVLLLEPSHFEKYPISDKSVQFMLDLSKNISGIQVFVGEFQDFKNTDSLGRVIYKEHPTNSHYKGTEESRDWMFSVEGYYPSFFAFWKKCKKELQ